MNATERSIFEQFDYWQQAELPEPLTDKSVTYVIIGCGTSYNLAMSMAAMFNEAGFVSIAAPAGEWLSRAKTYAGMAFPEKVKIIALSRSGETTETVNAAAYSRSVGIEVIGVTCAAPSKLAQNSDKTIYLPTHPQEGIVMTTSASLMLLAGMALAGHELAPGFHQPAEELLLRLAKADLKFLAGRSHVVFLGGGTLYGIAVEASLKLQEMSLSFTQAFHPLEYRHGPVSLVDEGSAIILLYNPQTRTEENVLAPELTEKRSALLGLDGAAAQNSSEQVGDTILNLDVSGLNQLLPLTLLPALQYFGEYIAQQKGLDTSAPRHLTKVVVLKE